MFLIKITSIQNKSDGSNLEDNLIQFRKHGGDLGGPGDLGGEGDLGGMAIWEAMSQTSRRQQAIW